MRRRAISLITIATTVGLLATVLSMAGCASAMMSLQSQPTGAEVFARRLGSPDASRSVGQTPLVLKTSDFESQVAGAGPFELEFRKDGYRSAKLVVTETSHTDLTLSAQLPPSSGLDDVDQLNSMIDGVFNVQRLARAGQYEEALKRIREIQKTAPQLSVTYELEGGIYYLRKDYRAAFEAFSQAAKYNPRSVQALRMRQKLRAPAATKASPQVASPQQQPPQAPPAPATPAKKPE